MLKGNMYSNILLLLILKNSKIFCCVEQKTKRIFDYSKHKLCGNKIRIEKQRHLPNQFDQKMMIDGSIV